MTTGCSCKQRIVSVFSFKGVNLNLLNRHVIQYVVGHHG